MEKSPIMASRLLAFLAALVALGAGAGIDEARASADPAALQTASTDFKARIETLIHRWFAILGNSTVEANALDPLLAEPAFELVLDGAVLHDQSALLAWVSDLRTAYPKIEYQLEPLRIHAEAQDRYRVRFEFDRHAVDDAGLSHVARREHTWIIQRNTHATPVILRIEERPLLFYSGTGPQIICY